MREIFVDTGFWVALLNPRDNLHELAVSLSEKYRRRHLITTDGVLIELQNFFSGYGKDLRAAAAKTVEEIESSASTQVLPQKRDTLNEARELYNARSDKQYSLTDCYSMVVIRERDISEVLTADVHFEQEGFVALMRK